MIFNIGNCGSAASAEVAAKVRARVAAHQRLVNLTQAAQELLATRTDYKKKAQGPLGLLADLQD